MKKEQKDVKNTLITAGAKIRSGTRVREIMKKGQDDLKQEFKDVEDEVRKFDEIDASI